MNTAAIAQHLNITESAIVRIEEWANVLFVVCRRIGARFVSKKIVEAKKVEEYTDIIEYNKALDFLAFTQFAGEKVTHAKRFSESASSPFLPRLEGWELTTVSGKVIKCTDKQKSQQKVPDGIINYTGRKHDQFESNQGYYH